MASRTTGSSRKKQTGLTVTINLGKSSTLTYQNKNLKLPKGFKVPRSWMVAAVTVISGAGALVHSGKSIAHNVEDALPRKAPTAITAPAPEQASVKRTSGAMEIDITDADGRQIKVILPSRDSVAQPNAKMAPIGLAR